tara:strand:- start:632 stop:1492 length:861 start_codon:yes stop_codon:yes gene_type:complete
MISSEILKKVKLIEIKTRGLVNNILGGQYHSAFKGRGMAFSEVREYYPGDDIKLIDWNVTARSNKPFVKVFEEERELTVYILVDMSASGDFGSKMKLKRTISSEIAAILGFSAIKNNDKVGLIFFSDIIEKYIAPRKGKNHIMRLIRELLYLKPRKKGTSIKNALKFLLNIAKRKSVIFLISDFLDVDFYKELKIVNKKHNVVGIKLSDPYEEVIPDLGLIKLKDNEDGKSFWYDTSNKSKEKKEVISVDFTKNQIGRFKKIGLDIITVSTEKDYVKPLVSFFNKF